MLSTILFCCCRVWNEIRHITMSTTKLPAKQQGASVRETKRGRRILQLLLARKCVRVYTALADQWSGTTSQYEHFVYIINILSAAYSTATAHFPVTIRTTNVAAVVVVLPGVVIPVRSEKFYFSFQGFQILRIHVDHHYDPALAGKYQKSVYYERRVVNGRSTVVDLHGCVVITLQHCYNYRCGGLWPTAYSPFTLFSLFTCFFYCSVSAESNRRHDSSRSVRSVPVG